MIEFRKTPLDTIQHFIDPNDLEVIIIDNNVYYSRVVPGNAGYYATTCGHLISFKCKEPKVIANHDTKKNENLYQRLSLNGKKEYLHRVIAFTFLAASEVKCANGGIRDEVNHMDGDRSNNAIANLQIVSRSENIKHRHILKAAKAELAELDKAA